MKRYELNGLGPDWIFEADSKEEATAKYLGQLLHGSDSARGTVEEYETYCEDIGTDSTIDWKEVYSCADCSRVLYEDTGKCEFCQEAETDAEFTERIHIWREEMAHVLFKCSYNELTTQQKFSVSYSLINC